MTDSSSDVARSEAYEQANVHDIYAKIAAHFSSTRHKPWPVIDDFLRALPPGAIGIDVGCGNGKYLQVRDDVYIVASDRSEDLCTFARRHQPHSAIVADTLALPHREGTFDFAISIAVIHHLSTRARRVHAVNAVLECLGAGTGGCGREGKALFFVWALEQRGSRRGWDESSAQDQMVPWVLRGDAKEKTDGDDDVQGAEKTIYHRFYHLYKQGELEEDVVAAGGEVIEKGYDRDNWWCVARRVI